MNREAGAKKSLGQNFLKCSDVVDLMVSRVKSHLGKARDLSILEIGPGRQALTKDLIKLAVDKSIVLYLVEKDDNLAAAIESEVGASDYSESVKVFNQDFLDFDLGANISGKYAVISSLPYNVSKRIIQILITASRPPEYGIFLLQKEVAEDYASSPPSMTFLGAYASLYSQPKILKNVPPECFDPRPAVDSAVIEFVGVEPIADAGSVTKLIRQGFTQPRKTLFNNLKASRDPGILLKEIEEVTGTGKARAQELSTDQWIQLAEKLLKR